MPSAVNRAKEQPRVTKFTNCLLVKQNRLVSQDLWIDARTGTILDSQSAFYSHHITPDQTIDLGGRIISPGFIDVQLNGAQGFDFSVPKDTAEEYEEGLKKVNWHLVRHGVTSYLPTVTSTRQEVYRKVLPHLGPSGADRDPWKGAESLGAHVEGPFLSKEKNGIHNTEVLRIANSLEDVEEMYGRENLYPRSVSKGTDGAVTGDAEEILPPRIKKMTAAPELGSMSSLIPQIAKDGRIFSIGHTTATYEQGLHAIAQGATMITHLFNAMLPFGHRDPGLFGLLGNHTTHPSSSMPRTIFSPISSPPSTPAKSPQPIQPPVRASSTSPSEPFRPFFGLIPDGIHLHPTTLALAHSSHPSGTILVTDSMPLTGLPDGKYPYLHAGDQIIKSGSVLRLEKNGRIAGSAVSLVECLNNFVRWTGAGTAEGVACVSETPAHMLGLTGKGRLEGGMDADLVVLEETTATATTTKTTTKTASGEKELVVCSVWKFGVLLYEKDDSEDKDEELSRANGLLDKKKANGV